jgi:hypothetical protein
MDLSNFTMSASDQNQKREAIRRRDSDGEPLAAERAAVPPVSQE